jgi:hypothetical protein
MAVANEAYRADNNACPAWSADPVNRAFGRQAQSGSSLIGQPS